MLSQTVVSSDLRQHLRTSASANTHRVDLRLKDSEGEVQVKDLQEVHDQTGNKATCSRTKRIQDKTEIYELSVLSRVIFT